MKAKRNMKTMMKKAARKANLLMEMGEDIKEWQKNRLCKETQVLIWVSFYV